MGKVERRIYDGDFKRDAISLSQESDKTMDRVEVSLGIPKGSISRWKRQLNTLGSLAFPDLGNEALTPEQREVRELKKQLRDTQMERDILKKAVGIFSKAPK